MTDAGTGAARPRSGSANANGRALVRNVVVNYVNLARATLIGLLVTPLLLKSLGTATFGVWSLALGATGYVALVDSGIAAALVSRVAAGEAREDMSEVASVLRSGQLLLATVTTIGAIALAIFTVRFNDIFDVPTSLHRSAQVALLLLGASTLLTIAGSSWSASLVGIGRVDLLSVLGFVTTTALAAGQVVLALCGAGIDSLAVTSLIISVISLAITRSLSRRHLRELPRVAASWRTASSLLNLGARNSLVGITILVAFGSDVLIVGAFAGPAAAAAYSVAARAAGFARTLATSVNDVLSPAFSHAAAKDDTARIRLLIESALFASLLVAIPLTTALATLAHPILSFWLGDSPTGSASVLIILCIFTLAQIPGTLAYIYLMGARKSNELLRFSIPTAAINVGLSILFTVRLGAIGPALGSLVTTCLIDPFLLRHIARRVVGIRTRDLFRTVASTLLPPGLGTLVIALAVRPLVVHHPVASPFVAIGIGVVFIVLSAVWLRTSGRGSGLAPAVRAVPRIGGHLERILLGREAAAGHRATWA